MKIIVKQLQPHNILLYFLFCCFANIAFIYSILADMNRVYLTVTASFSVISHLATLAAIYLNRDKKNRLFGSSYIKYCPTNNSLYVSDEMKKIGDIESILTEEISQEEDSLSIMKILENLKGYSFPKSLVLKFNERSYKVMIIQIKSKIFATFIDISEDFEKYLHLESLYKEVLKERESLKLILDVIPVAIWNRNENMEIIYFNNTYSNIVFGYQKPFEADLLEIDKLAILSAEKAFAENKSIVSERSIIIEGKMYLYQIIDIPLVKNGMVTSVAWDISNKELLHKELQEVILSHQNLLESSSNACMIIGADGRLKYYNDALVKFWGPDEGILNHETTHEEIIDHLYTKRKLPEQYNYAKFKKERTSLSNTLTGPREDLFYLPDGKCLRCVVIPHPGNSILFTYEDVTEKLSLERMNHTLNAVQKYTIDNLQEGICVFNETGGLELLNAGMSKLWDLEILEDHQNMNLAEIIEKILGEGNSEIECEELRDAFTKVMVSRIAAKQTIKNFKGNIIHRSMIPLPNRGIMVSDLDITDSVSVKNALIEKNEALVYVDKIKSEFLANMSYELRNPLATILGLSQLLLLHDYDNLSDSQRGRLGNMLQAAEELTKLVDDAIEITNISAGYTELDLEEFDLNEVIRTIILESTSSLSLRNVSCTYEHDMSKAILISDRIKFKHAVTELIENSIYRSKDVTKIDIALKVKGDFYILSITDDGPQLYEKDTRKNSTKSTGLRYILARAIILLLQGKISSKYSHNTNATSFIIELPKNTH
jgi:signal transduction histidine kinase/PAS domain-containing protein